MLSQEVSVEDELEENVHFVGFLGVDQTAVILNIKLVEAQESEVSKDVVHGHVVSVQGGRVALVEDFSEDLL
jgi:hypothetical protein